MGCIQRKFQWARSSRSHARVSFSTFIAAAKFCRDYQSYFDSIPIQAGPNQSLFWSKTFSIVEMVSTQPNPAGVLVHSSTNEPSSAVINDLGYDTYWCGLEGGKRCCRGSLRFMIMDTLLTFFFCRWHRLCQ